MRRGDIVTVAVSGDYGKPRPAVIVQTNALPPEHPSMIICQMTSEIVDASDLRVLIEPDAGNGLRLRSQIIADKPVTIRRERVGRVVGKLSATDIARLNEALAFVMGLAD
jgi:mRNA interferase MazF